MRTRILEGDELGQLVNAGGPFHGRHDVVSQLGNAQVVVVEADDGRILAYWPIWVAIHLEPLWVDDAERGNPGVVRAIVQGMRNQLHAQRITTAFAVIGHADLATHLPMAARLGFQRMPGDLFFLTAVTAVEERDDGSSGNPSDQPRRPVLLESSREETRQQGPGHRDDGPPGLGD